MFRTKVIEENIDKEYLRFQAEIKKRINTDQMAVDVYKLIHSQPKLRQYKEILIEVGSLAVEYRIPTDPIFDHTLPAFFSNAPKSIYENLKDHLISIFFFGRPKPSPDHDFFLKFENKLTINEELKTIYLNPLNAQFRGELYPKTLKLKDSDLFVQILPTFFNHAPSEVYPELEHHLNTIYKIFKRADDGEIGTRFLIETFWPALMKYLPEKLMKHLDFFSNLIMNLIFEYVKKIDPQQKYNILEEFYRTFLPLFLESCPHEIYNDQEKFKVILWDLGTILVGSEIDTNFKYFIHMPWFLHLTPKKIITEYFENFFKPKDISETRFLFSVFSDFSFLWKFNFIKWETVRSPRDMHEQMVTALNELFKEGLTLSDLKKYSLGYMSRDLIKKINLKEKVTALLHKKFRNFPTHFEINDETGFMLSAIALLSDANKILEDKNISYIFSTFKKYGTIANYYRNKKNAVLNDLQTTGFNLDHLLSDQVVHQTSLSGISHNKSSQSFEERFRNLVQGLLGTKKTQPKNLFEFNGQQSKIFKIYSKIAQDYHPALKGDREAANRVIDFFLNLLNAEKLKVKKIETKLVKNRILEEYHDLFSGLKGETSQPKILQPKGLRAIRSQFRIPEILFDNKRLTCCIFKPDGEMADEISLMILDPKTPLLEIWIEGEPDFMGVATQYLGVNARLEPVVLIDTFETNQSIFSFGKNYGQQFVLDAIVKDAHLLGAKEVAIFECRYGKPLEFVSFVKNIAKKKEFQKSITVVKKYYFKAVDVSDTESLKDSRMNKHHYTDAFGDNAILNGFKPCLVVNIEEYLSLRKNTNTDF